MSMIVWIAVATLGVLAWNLRFNPSARSRREQTRIASQLNAYIRLINNTLSSPALCLQYTDESRNACLRAYYAFHSTCVADPSGPLLIYPDPEAWHEYLALPSRTQRFHETLPAHEARLRERFARQKTAGIRESRAFSRFRMTPTFDKQLPQFSADAIDKLKQITRGGAIDVAEARSIGALDVIDLSVDEDCCFVRLKEHPETLIGVLRRKRVSA